MLIVTQREMKRAFRAHLQVFRDAPTPPSCSHHLALVYAVECGLKAQVMVERGAADTNGLPETLTRSGGGHDLRAGLKELRAPATLVPRDQRTRQRAPQPVPSHQLHQAFRYGVELEDACNAIEHLHTVASWLERRA